MLIDNFEQQLESRALNAQNAPKSAQNQINSLSASRNELMKIFRGFRIFKYALWQKTKTQKCWRSTKGFLNQKNTHL